MSNLHVIDHPLITHKLSIMRNRKTGSKDFTAETKEAGRNFSAQARTLWPSRVQNTAMARAVATFSAP